MTEKINNSEDAQFAENEDIEKKDEISKAEYENKRKLLERTKITKQTWSIREIFQKRKENVLIVDPAYQRNIVWDTKKKTSFIESLFMEIIVPPIYVVEITPKEVLEENRYEVVDGKQRLSAIDEFLKNNLILNENALEYYQDLLGKKSFMEINEIFPEKIRQLLSYVLDVYVITANSPPETKYDIFARLNKGSEPLKVNELRKALYCSEVTQFIDKYLASLKSENGELFKEYKELFSENDIKRYNDYGRFYRSIAFYYRNDISLKEVKNYNSRPREMINNVLLELQKGIIPTRLEEIEAILLYTLKLKRLFFSLNDREFLIDACINFAITDWEKLEKKLTVILSDEEIKSTFSKSSSTTSNVNKRLKRVIEIMEG
ncbi:DUF262 domain-containing protein [Fusobacterium mortiferum]|uniref:DUF262 domain-containing protein n=1 Tax=Fusobacterium mortiferum TaxID=850 RepID=UPI001F169BF7|nr:DUF262 domain-containing protein [Fusobacterium mortiferum]MCF2626913.1 DUF262 domain-containing protein [Fusobacterium mortiferum]